MAETGPGWIAGAIAAIYPPLITADGLVMSEPLFVLRVAAALLVALTLLSSPTRRRAGFSARSSASPSSPAARGSCCSDCSPGRPRSPASPLSADARVLATTAAAVLVVARG